MGGESTGKSTLTINLANRFNTNYIDEAGRDISERSGTDLLMLSEDFTEILLQHKLNEMKAIEHSNKVLFIDTDALNEYDLILFMEPDVAFVQDGDRSEVIKNDREKYSRQIKELIQAHGKQFISVSGTYQERYEKAVAEVEKLLK